MIRRPQLAPALALLPMLAAGARAACPPSCPLPGGGPARLDCHAEFAATAMGLNYPPFDPAAPRPGREVRCFDGDAGCDLDGEVNGECRFPIDVCLLKDPDPALPTCTPASPSSVDVKGRTGDSDLQALQTELDALNPAAQIATVCTAGHSLRVPLRSVAGRPPKRASRRISLVTHTASGNDKDRLKLTCVPHGWPGHGYDHRNRRVTPLETILGPTNAASMVVKWQLDLLALEGPGLNGVTSTPTVGNGLVYVTSWNGKVYAVRSTDGSVAWSYDTGSKFIIGVQSSATLTADGRVLVGDSTSTLHCLNATNGRLLWSTTIGNVSVDHIWASPQVVGKRVFMGIASHSDNPCTNGRLVALDLDTGAVLWTLQTVPDKICHNDTTIACTSDADCGGAPGSCVASRGAGVTATVAVEPTGQTVYMATVGCYTFPSVGDEDSIFSVDAATGAVNWKYRTVPGEQFADGPPYHDYGFLNGPMLVDGDDGLGGTRPLVVGGSKDGTLYALHPTGAPLVWTNPLIPLPEFAGFGLFNGATGFANHTFFSTLFDGGGSWPAANDHLYAFHDLDGSVAWSAQIGASWGSMAVANGLLFVGTQSGDDYYVYDADTGARLKTFTLPSPVASGASIVDGAVYVGYGVFDQAGGVMALGLP